MVFPFLGLATMGSLSFGVKIAEKIGYRLNCFVCGIIICVAFVILSYITSFGGFVAIYCLMIGIPGGLAYMSPISNIRLLKN